MAAYSWMPLLPEVCGTGTSPSLNIRSATISAALAESTMVIPAPGSRSTTTRLASGSPGSWIGVRQVDHPARGVALPKVHCGTWSSSAARLASQTTVAASSATT